MNVELLQTQKKLIETQMALLQYQYRDVVQQLAARENQTSEQEDLARPEDYKLSE